MTFTCNLHRRQPAAWYQCRNRQISCHELGNSELTATDLNTSTLPGEPRLPGRKSSPISSSCKICRMNRLRTRRQLAQPVRHPTHAWPEAKYSGNLRADHGALSANVVYPPPLLDDWAVLRDAVVEDCPHRLAGGGTPTRPTVEIRADTRRDMRVLDSRRTGPTIIPSAACYRVQTTPTKKKTAQCCAPPGKSPLTAPAPIRQPTRVSSFLRHRFDKGHSSRCGNWKTPKILFLKLIPTSSWNLYIFRD